MVRIIYIIIYIVHMGNKYMIDWLMDWIFWTEQYAKCTSLIYSFPKYTYYCIRRITKDIIKTIYNTVNLHTFYSPYL
jgi:hypothetical protein